jgi:hypothetical protein
MSRPGKISFVFIASLALFCASVAVHFLFNSEEACAARLSSCAPKCGACSANVKGTWNYFRQGKDNEQLVGPITLVLSQTGYRVKNTNTSTSPVTFTGTVFGSSIDFSLTVSGEELEGYVNFCEGHVIDNEKIVAVCNDRDGVLSTFTAQKD